MARVKTVLRLEDLDRDRYAVREYQGSGGDIHIVRDDEYSHKRWAVAYKGVLCLRVGRRSPWERTHSEVLRLAQTLVDEVV